MKTKIDAANPFEEIHQILWEVLKNRPRGKHLDYGCYDGAVVRILGEKGLVTEAVGVDLNEKVVTAHRKKMPKNTKLQVIKKGDPLPFPDGTFDSISCFGVLEHVADQGRLLNELKRVLKPTGVFVVAVPGKHLFSFLDLGNFKFVFPYLHRLYYSRRFGADAYRRRYLDCPDGLFGDIETEKMWHQHFSHKELEALLQSSGFRGVLQDGMGLFYRVFWLTEMLIPATKRVTKRLRKWDMKTFDRGEIVTVAEVATSH